MATKPKDYLRGNYKKVGDKYTAWSNKSGTKPDFGKGARGPGIPYKEVQKTIPKPKNKTNIMSGPGAMPTGAVSRKLRTMQPKGAVMPSDAKSKAIARRLGR